MSLIIVRVLYSKENEVCGCIGCASFMTASCDLERVKFLEFSLHHEKKPHVSTLASPFRIWLSHIYGGHLVRKHKQDVRFCFCQIQHDDGQTV